MKVISFLCGTVFGIYLEQKYDLPNVEKLYTEAKELLEEKLKKKK